MKNIILSLILVFLLFGMLLPSGMISADSDDDDSDNSGSGNDNGNGNNNRNGNSGSDDDDDSDDDDEDEDKTDDDEDENENYLEIKIRNGQARVKVEYNGVKQEFNIPAQEREQLIEIIASRLGITIEELKNFDEIKYEEKHKYIDENGTEIEYKIEEEIENGKIKRKIEFKGVGADTELEIEEEVENGKTKLKIKMKNGNFTSLDIMPDEVLVIIRAKIKNMGENYSIEIEEKIHKNIPRVVYNVQTNQNGRFLGVFKLAMRAEIEIDPETGEVISLSRPWWAFLVTVPEEPEEPEEPGNETENNVPVITSNPVTIVDENSSYEYQVTATDADNDTLTYSLTEHPEWISINSTDGLVSGTTPVVENSTDYTIGVDVSDGIDFDTQEYNLTVNNIA